MDKKAFTLIELLAVIVILGILALIVTPILINVVKDSNEKSYKLSADGYISAVNDYILSNQLDGKKVENGKYNIKNLDVKISGKAPSKGSVEIYDEKINNLDENLYVKDFDQFYNDYKNSSSTITEEQAQNIATTAFNEALHIAGKYNESSQTYEIKSIHPNNFFTRKVHDSDNVASYEVTAYCFRRTDNIGNGVEIYIDNKLGKIIGGRAFGRACAWPAACSPSPSITRIWATPRARWPSRF